MLWQVKSSLRNFKLVIILGDFGAHEMCFQHLNEPNSVPQWLGYSSSCKTTSFDEIIYLLLTYMEKPHVSWQKLEIYWKIIDTSKKVNFFFITMQKIMSKVQIYPQNVCLFIVASYILNNLVIHQNWESHYIMKKHSLTTTNTVILFWVQNQSIVYNLHLRTACCGNLAKTCGCNS